MHETAEILCVLI